MITTFLFSQISTKTESDARELSFLSKKNDDIHDKNFI